MGASPVSIGSGCFVVLVGPDGVGKTTVARALLAQHQGPAGYFHFLPLDGPLPRSPDAASIPPPKAGPGGSPVLGWIRLLRNAARCWVGYLRVVRPALKRHWLIVGDRWMYGYVVQPDTLKFHGPDLLALAVLRLLPSPHLIVNLTAPPHVIRARKQELVYSARA
jgi:thymidylate kinase